MSAPIRMNAAWGRGCCVQIVHWSIPNIEQRVLHPIIFKTLPALISAYFLIPFPLSDIGIFEFLEPFKLILFSRLLYIQFFYLANTYLFLLKFVGPALLLVCVNGGSPKRWQIEMSLSVDLYQIITIFLFLFSTLKFFRIFTLSSYKTFRNPKI